MKKEKDYDDYIQFVFGEFIELFKRIGFEDIRKTKKGRVSFKTRLSIPRIVTYVDRYTRATTEIKISQEDDDYYKVIIYFDLEALVYDYEKNLTNLHYDKHYSQYALLKERPEFEMDEPYDRFIEGNPYDYKMIDLGMLMEAL